METSDDPGKIVASLAGAVREPVVLTNVISIELNEGESAFTYAHRAVDANFGSIFAAIVLRNLPQHQNSIGGLFAKHVAATAGPIPNESNFNSLLQQQRFDNENEALGASLSPFNAAICGAWRLSLK